jgi:hypothetical protein
MASQQFIKKNHGFEQLAELCIRLDPAALPA